MCDINVDNIYYILILLVKLLNKRHAKSHCQNDVSTKEEDTFLAIINLKSRNIALITIIHHY